jgi:TadE-like protein
MIPRRANTNQRGAALVEFAIGATVMLTAVFAVLEFGRALWTHNALADAARRGARYAVIYGADDAKIKNVVIYGNAAGGTKPLIPDLDVDNVQVDYSTNPPFGLAMGTATVSIVNYDFAFVIPIVGTSIRMPNYRTTLSGENAGAPIPGGAAPPPTPTPAATPTPTSTPSPTPTPLPSCTKGQVIGSPPVCTCNTKEIGNPPKCQ